MLRWTVAFLTIVLITGVLIFVGLASGAGAIAKVLFFVFIFLFLASIASGRKSRMNP